MYLILQQDTDMEQAADDLGLETGELSYLVLTEKISTTTLCNIIRTPGQDSIKICVVSPGKETCIFKTILLTEELELRNLDIGWNDLSSVPADILAKAVLRLTRVNLRDCNLSNEQTLAIFGTIYASEESELKYLDIGQNELSMVAPDILAKVVFRLEEINFECCNLSIVQLHSIFQTIETNEDFILNQLNICDHEITPDYKKLLIAARRKVATRVVKVCLNCHNSSKGLGVDFSFGIKREKKMNNNNKNNNEIPQLILGLLMFATVFLCILFSEELVGIVCLVGVIQYLKHRWQWLIG